MSAQVAEVITDVMDWPKRWAPAPVVVHYIAHIGLRPEDSYGVMPSGENAKELVFFYRDRPEYQAARADYAQLKDPEWTRGNENGDDSAVAAYGGPRLVIHSLRYPGTTTGVRDWAPPREAFTLLSDVFGLRPEDTYGFFPQGWDSESITNRWGALNLIYRDRPGYAEGRARMAALEHDYDADGVSFHGLVPDAPAGPPTTGIDLREEPWPRRSKWAKLKGDRLIIHIGERIEKSKLRPEVSYGLGPDRLHEKLWFARRPAGRA